MGPGQTYQIAQPPQWGKYSLKSVMLCGADEQKLGYRKITLFKKLIRSQEGRFTKLLKNQPHSIMIGWT